MTRHTAEVVLVGAGVVGASVAWHLARRGCRDVVVVERAERPGEGSTGRATGGFRVQFGSAVNVGLSLLAREELAAFPELVGGETVFDPCGYLFLASSDGALTELRAAIGVQREAGLGESREVGLDEIREINPHASLAGVLGGTWCPTDGFVRPLAVLGGYLDAARRLGVEVRFGEEVVGIRVEGGELGGESGGGGGPRIAGVVTGRGEIATRRVVNAAGAWAGGLAAMAGAELPVVPERRQVAATRPFEGLPERMPMTIWADDGFHLRVRDGRVLLLRPRETAGESPFDTRFDPGWLDGLIELARERVLALAGAEIDPAASWCGLYEISPDRHAILGESPDVAGLYFANGSSGHGVMHAPALGLLLAELLLDGQATSLDVTPLDPGRFRAGRPNRAPTLL